MKLSKSDCEEIREALGGKATGYTYADIAIWLRHADFEPPKKSSGSHRTWRHPSGRRVPLVDKGHSELLPVYVKTAARRILEVGGCN